MQTLEQIARNHAMEVRNRLMNPALANKVENSELKNTIKELREQVSRLEKDAERKNLDLADLQAVVLSQAARICDLEGLELKTDGRKTAKSIIMNILKGYPDITYEDIVGRRRNIIFMEPRHACMKAVYDQRKDLSTIQIGRIFDRDHSSILSAVGRLKRNPK